MSAFKPFDYVPVLRAKLGEQTASARLTRDVADRIRPRWIVPPPKERDPEKKRELTFDEIINITGHRISHYWRTRPSFLDTHFLFRDFGHDCSEWLPRIFRSGRETGSQLTPVATPEDLIGIHRTGFLAAIDTNTDIQLAIRIVSGDLAGDLAAKLTGAIAGTGIDPSRCAILLDFGDADLSEVSILSPIIQGAFEDVQTIAPWAAIIFQGTNYPEHNPAPEDGSAVVGRNEWLAWRALAKIDNNALDRLIFGDYCADSAKFVFKSGGGIPHKHYRYCTPDGSWLIQRGKAEESYEKAMRSVADKILSSGKFSGPEFSWADETIYATAKGYMGPGNATLWRAINTAHHITQVISDIGGLKGYSIGKRAIQPHAEQLRLFQP